MVSYNYKFCSEYELLKFLYPIYTCKHYFAKKFGNFSIPILFICVSQMLNVLRKIHLHVYRLLRLVLDFDSLTSRKKSLRNSSIATKG